MAREARMIKAEAVTSMGRLIKYLFYLAILAGIALVGYAYVGPYFGVDFSPPAQEIREPVILDAG